MSDTQGQVGPYALKRLLATGSQSQVWNALGPDGPVALKLARTDAHRAALAREVAVLGLGTHPGMPELIEHDPQHRWLALEHIRGSQIDQWAQVQDLDTVLGAVIQLLDVLEHLHGHGVLHGDIKPSNVLVDSQGQVKLIDLGIASTPADRPDGFSGTLGYAAPELLEGKTPTLPAADLYGVGALLYTCLTGRPPFVAADPAALTYIPLVSLPAPASAFNPDLPAGLDLVLLDLLARDPARRPDSLEKTRRLLLKAAKTMPTAPILGMLEEREELRKAVVGAADGEPRVVVLYGPPGSGRRTLLTEAVAFARREGLTYHKGSDVRALLAAIKKGDKPVAAVLRGTSKNAQKLASHVLKEGLPALILLHSDRPIPGLKSKGGIQLTPAPLSQLEVTRLARVLAADEAHAADWWRESLGLPIGVLGRIRAWRRTHAGDDLSVAHLPGESMRILEALADGQALAVEALAEKTKQTENQLLDHCEVLFAEELVVPEDSGNALRLADGVSL